MGNCCRKPSAVDWAGDDWGSFGRSAAAKRSSKVFDEGHAWEGVVPEKKKLLSGMMVDSSSNSSGIHNGKVTIKISKKELEELMAAGVGKKEREGRGASAEQVLVRLLSARDQRHRHQAHHGPWRPVLQSIPELD